MGELIAFAKKVNAPSCDLHYKDLQSRGGGEKSDDQVAITVQAHRMSPRVSNEPFWTSSATR